MYWSGILEKYKLRVYTEQRIWERYQEYKILTYRPTTKSEITNRGEIGYTEAQQQRFVTFALKIQKTYMGGLAFGNYGQHTLYFVNCFENLRLILEPAEAIAL